MLPTPGSRTGAVLHLTGTNAGCWVMSSVFHCQDFKKSLLEHYLLVFGLFPLPNLIDKGLEVAGAAMVSENRLQWGPCPWQGLCGRLVLPTCSSPCSPSLVWLPLSLSSHSGLSHAVLMRAWPPVHRSAAVHLINILTLQFFRVNAAILFLTNWKRLVKL